MSLRTTATVARAGLPGNEESVGVLVEGLPDCVNGFDDKVDECEEIGFLVDSGASATVVVENDVRAVCASAPNPNRHYNIADGSFIPHDGVQGVQSSKQ